MEISIFIIKINGRDFLFERQVDLRKTHISLAEAGDQIKSNSFKSKILNLTVLMINLL